jgi:thiosulfate dehydrogenase (quinone) large subunit
MRERVPLVCLFPLRVLVGVMLVLSGYQKFQSGWLHGTALLVILEGWLADHKVYPFILPVVETARAHPKIFGTLVTMGEMIIGSALVIGLFTRFASILGTLVFMTFAFASGERLTPPGPAMLVGAILFTFVLIPPGRVLGLDHALRGRLPAWLS